ncbi:MULTISPECIES: hypothetical protein [Streptosporangium]|uniref:Uncharacterized protein n=1 Tax=Streptosporangium brasiliense TaxID=47480 RepID=A0ABT9RM26_9ACTN|nr:hypothetical protein [Streptosporangium brasiliense]MDP9870354.1 hypothetical protein [Streptosporangium brasiliense]
MAVKQNPQNLVAPGYPNYKSIDRDEPNVGGTAQNGGATAPHLNSGQVYGHEGLHLTAVFDYAFDDAKRPPLSTITPPA